MRVMKLDKWVQKRDIQDQENRLLLTEFTDPFSMKKVGKDNMLSHHIVQKIHRIPEKSPAYPIENV